MNFFDIESLLRLIKKKKRVTLSGLSGSAISLMAMQMARAKFRVILLTQEHRIEHCFREIASFLPNSIIEFIDRNHLTIRDNYQVLITTRKFLNEAIGQTVEQQLKVGDIFAPEELVGHLLTAHYTKEEMVEEEGEFARRGGIVDIFVDGEEKPFRFEFSGNEIVSIRTFDPLTQRSIEILDRATIKFYKSGSLRLIEKIHRDALIIVDDASESPLEDYQNLVVVNSAGEVDFGLAPPRLYFGNLAELKTDVERSDSQFYLVTGSSPIRDQILVSAPQKIKLVDGYLAEGFVDKRQRLVVLTEYEIFGHVRVKPKRSRFKGLFIDDLLGLKIGDYVVHEEFGIGQFAGLKILKCNGNQVECLVINYAGGDRIFVPVERLNLVERYIGSEGRPPRLSRLGRELWFKTRSRVKAATELLAVELLKLYALRVSVKGFIFSKDDKFMQSLELSFPYEETQDQIRAMEDVKNDMESPKVMDRLICGDVGFGKTEVAIRAALKAVLSGKQVCLIAPTTLLTFQHYKTFGERLKMFPVKIDMLSRLKDRSEQKRIIEEISNGKIDIIIGTHRLLQGDINFKDLGLLIIDEEQRFGVMQKEKIKKLRAQVDTLLLSATPIPRTLYMCLSGIRDISVIHSPPLGRKGIITKVLEWDDDEIRQAIIFEKKRGGQVFFVHNRIETIDQIYHRLHQLLPDFSICMLHGRMSPSVIERTMIEFLEGKYDILLSTAIVESGLDLPRVNTIIINRADLFGLADLHQLRGRVGRTEIQAYAYFIIPEEKKLTPEAKKRLGSILTYTSLGSGFRLAIRDMEIRGVGNLLGREQHGFVNMVGYHLYLRLLSEAVDALKGRPVRREPVLDLKINGYIPEEYISDAFERVALYKRLMQAESLYEIDNLIEELKDRFGKFPAVLENLFNIARIRILAKLRGVELIHRVREKFIIKFPDRKVEIVGDIKNLEQVLK